MKGRQNPFKLKDEQIKNYPVAETDILKEQGGAGICQIQGAYGIGERKTHNGEQKTAINVMPLPNCKQVSSEGIQSALKSIVHEMQEGGALCSLITWINPEKRELVSYIANLGKQYACYVIIDKFGHIQQADSFEGKRQHVTYQPDDQVFVVLANEGFFKTNKYYHNRAPNLINIAEIIKFSHRFSKKECALNLVRYAYAEGKGSTDNIAVAVHKVTADPTGLIASSQVIANKFYQQLSFILNHVDNMNWLLNTVCNRIETSTLEKLYNKIKNAEFEDYLRELYMNDQISIWHFARLLKNITPKLTNDLTNFAEEIKLIADQAYWSTQGAAFKLNFSSHFFTQSKLPDGIDDIRKKETMAEYGSIAENRLKNDKSRTKAVQDFYELILVLSHDIHDQHPTSHAIRLFVLNAFKLKWQEDLKLRNPLRPSHY